MGRCATADRSSPWTAACSRSSGTATQSTKLDEFPDHGAVWWHARCRRQYYFFTDDSELLLRHRAKILGLAATLRTLRSRALRLPKDDATYGMPRGNDEADTYIGTIVCGTTYGNRTEAEHCKTEQPYISISSEMVRGFRELGAAFTAIGKAQGRSDVASEGAQLSREAEELHGDFITSLRRSTLAPNASWGGNVCHPHIAGWPSCEWDIGLPPIEGTGAGLGAQIRPNQKTFAMEGRTYSEALYSGVLPPDYVKDIVVFVAGYIGVMGVRNSVVSVKNSFPFC